MNYLINNRRKSVIFIAVTTVVLLFAVQSLTMAQAQQRKFKSGDTIQRGTKTYEIVECRIRPNSRVEECDYLVIHEDGSEGSLLTEPVFDLRRYVQENEAEKKRQDAINKRNQTKNQTKPPIKETPEETTQETVPPSEIPSEEVEMTVTAQQFYKDYQNNDIAATRKYVGKTVRVTGAIVFTISSSRFSATISKQFLGSTIQCRVEDLEQLATLNKGETLTIIGVPLGSMMSTGVEFEPCRVERKTANQNVKPITQKTPDKTSGTVGGKVVGTWYYTAIINADGTEKKLSNSESYLWLKDDGSYENRFGTVGQIGTYTAGGSRLTLNRENVGAKTYTMTIGGNTMTLKSGAGGYKLERE